MCIQNIVVELNICYHTLGRLSNVHGLDDRFDIFVYPFGSSHSEAGLLANPKIILIKV